MRWRPAPMCSDPVAANSSTARAPSIGPQRKSLNRKTGGSRRSSSAGDFCENEMAAAAGHARCRFAARVSAPLHQGIKTTIAPAGNVEARGWRRAPRPVRWRPAPMCSDPVAANSSTARAPSIGPQRKSLNRKTGGSRRSSSAGDFCENEMAAAAGHARCRFAARVSAPLHQGIKTTIAPAGNVEARGWRRAPRPVRWRPAPMCSDPVAANSSTARAPSIGPQRKSLNRKTGGSRRSSSAGDFCENEMAAAAGHARCQFAARVSAPLHQGIKTTIAPAGNVEARGWRRALWR